MISTTFTYSIVLTTAILQGSDASFLTDRCRISSRGQQAQTVLQLVQQQPEVRSPIPGSSFHQRRGGRTSICKGGRITQIRRGGTLFNSDPQLESEVSRKPASSQYFLLSTFAIWRSIVINTIILFTVRIAIKSFMPGMIGTSTALKYETCHNSNWFVRIRDVSIPLLSSACCAFQLFLNAFFAGAGCAGFNKKLGPLRPYFTSVLLFTTIQTFSKHKIAQLSLAWAVALMPEAVHVTNQRIAKISSKNREILLSTRKPIICTHTAVIDLNIKDMGCVACINKIDGVLQTSERNVIVAKSWLNIDDIKGGKARVELELERLDFLDETVEKIVRLVKDAGFQCEISNVEAREL